MIVRIHKSVSKYRKAFRRLKYIYLLSPLKLFIYRALDVYWNGYWFGDLNPSDSNLESNFLLARILEYLECPQYLRRAVFPKQKALQYAGERTRQNEK